MFLGLFCFCFSHLVIVLKIILLSTTLDGNKLKIFTLKCKAVDLVCASDEGLQSLMCRFWL